MTPDHTDVLIAGGGFTGLTLAIALKQALGAPFAVTVADPALGRSHAGDERASAIVAAARRLFEAIGVWDKVADNAQPILDMVVTDSRLADATRPTFLTFGGDIEPGEPFAHMIDNRLLVGALEAKARERGVELLADAVKEMRRGENPQTYSAHSRESGNPAASTGAADSWVPAFAGTSGWRTESRKTHSSRLTATLAGGDTLSARLLVAADGARSAIREAAGIATHGWNYDQSAIVINVAHERDHHGRAEEHFLPAGPFAILPLKGRRSSIVWTERSDEAARIMALPDEEFHAELEQRFKLHLGELSVIGARRVHPLGFFVARAFIAGRIALAGDAAHVIHPIAGQGLNMGLKDVAALAETIVDAARLGLDPGSESVLEKYQRWRRFDTVTMGFATDGLNRLFSNRSDALRLARDVGLGMVERLPGLKHLFIREAAGLVGDVPKLLRGQVL